jgi:hypothetical protein
LLGRTRDRAAVAAVRPPSHPMMPPKDDQGHGFGFGGEREDSWSAYRLLCACGYAVRCEVTHYGERLGGLVFFDDKDASMTRGERVWHCPGCHGLLGLLGLRS